MLKVALNSITSHKLRMALTALSIILGVSFVSGTYIFTDSINAQFDTLFEDAFEGTDATVRPLSTEIGQSDRAFSDDVLELVKDVDGVDTYAVSAQGFAQFVSRDGEPIGGTGAPVFGETWVHDPDLNAFNIKEGNGRPPIGAGEVVIDAKTAKDFEFTVGDTVLVQSSGPVEEFTIVGIASFGESDSILGATLAAFELREAQRVFELEGQYSEISFTAVDGVSQEELQSRLSEVIPDELEVVTGAMRTDENLQDINEGLGFITTALLTFAGVAIFVGSFIIQNTFRIIISQRSKELALLRAVGATRSQVLRMVLAESIVIATLASILGVVAGFVIAYVIRGLGNAAGLDLPEGRLVFESRTIIVGMAVGILVTIVSSLLPALKASRTSPMEALRANDAAATSRSLRKRGIVSGLVFLFGVAIMLYGLFGDEVPNALETVGFGVFLQFIGVAAFAPLLSGPIGSLFGLIVERTSGIPGKLAVGNMRRSPRQTASTAAALMIGVSLVAFVSIFASSVNATIETVIKESLPADLSVLSGSFGEGVVREQAALDLEELEEIETVSRTAYVEAFINGEKIQNFSIVIAVEPETFGEMVLLKPDSGNYDKLQSMDTIYVFEEYLEARDWSVNDTVVVNLSDTLSYEATIIGTFSEAFDSPVLTSIETIKQYREIDEYTALYASLVPGIEVEEGKAATDKVAKDYPNISIKTAGELVADAKESINQLLGLLWGLLGFAVIIAVFGITNTLALSISERIRELGLLRAIGMLKKQVRSMIRIESILISLFGATLGIVMGIFFGWALLKALESEGLTSFVVPWSQIILYYIMAAIAGVIASIWPARTASKINVLDALEFE